MMQRLQTVNPSLHTDHADRAIDIDGATGVGRKPIPRPGFLDTCQYLGYVHGERRWRSQDGRHLLTWDSLHGEVEVFTTRGTHIGTRDAITGQWIKDAVPGRRIDV